MAKVATNSKGGFQTVRSSTYYKTINFLTILIEKVNFLKHAFLFMTLLGSRCRCANYQRRSNEYQPICESCCKNGRTKRGFKEQKI